MVGRRVQGRHLLEQSTARNSKLECSRQITQCNRSHGIQFNHLQGHSLYSNLVKNVQCNDAMVCKSVQGIGLQECSRQLLARAFNAISSQSIQCNHLQVHLLHHVKCVKLNDMQECTRHWFARVFKADTCQSIQCNQ